MHDNGQGLISSAIRQARRVRRTTGRLVVSGLGFGLAYYFDMENGAERREQLRRLAAPHGLHPRLGVGAPSRRPAAGFHTRSCGGSGAEDCEQPGPLGQLRGGLERGSVRSR